MRRLLPAAALGCLLLAACTGEGGSDGATPSPTQAAPSPTPSVSPGTTATEEDVRLGEAPGGDSGLWLDTIGVPVAAAVRTSTPLARLAEVDAEQRAATCRQVATDLDGIAAPQVLTGLAITADAETATLLVADLQAKGDLLAACEQDGEDLSALIGEVERTHNVAVRWLGVLGGEG